MGGETGMNAIGSDPHDLVKRRASRSERGKDLA